MHRPRPPEAHFLWFVLGLAVLVIGAAYLLASFFFASFDSKTGGLVGSLGLLLMLVGGLTAVGSIVTLKSAGATDEAMESRVR